MKGTDARRGVFNATNDTHQMLLLMPQSQLMLVRVKLSAPSGSLGTTLNPSADESNISMQPTCKSSFTEYHKGPQTPTTALDHIPIGIGKRPLYNHRLKISSPPTAYAARNHSIHQPTIHSTCLFGEVRHTPLARDLLAESHRQPMSLNAQLTSY